MDWELDHVFLACSDAEASRRALTDFGIVLGAGRTHKDQGTANLCAFFENAFLELLFPVDVNELESDTVKPLGLSERIHWQETGACPFGVCFRPASSLSEEYLPPVECWPYVPSYLPQGSSIPIVTPRGSIYEPLVFLSTRVRANPQKVMTTHRGARRTLTGVQIQHPQRWCPSEGVNWFAENACLSFFEGPEHNLELIWGRGGNGRGEVATLPLSVSW